jgi:integrase
MSELYRLPTPGSTWKHRGGDEYTVIGLTSEPDAEKADKFPRTVFYRGPDGRQWTRTLESWRASFTFVREGADDAALFRYWIKEAAARPARVATALVNCITPDDYRHTLTRLMERDRA